MIRHQLVTAIELFGYIEQNRSGNAAFGNNRFSAILTATSDLAVACVEGTGSVTELTFDNVDLGYSAIFLNARRAARTPHAR